MENTKLLLENNPTDDCDWSFMEDKTVINSILDELTPQFQLEKQEIAVPHTNLL